MSDRTQHTQRGLTPLDPNTFVLSALAVKDGKRTPRQFAGDLKSYAEVDHLQGAFDTLVAAGKAQVNASGKAALTAEGKREAQRRFGKLPGGKEGMKRLQSMVWPALALGLEPNSKATAKRLQPDNLRAVLLVSLFQLPLDKGTATLAGVVSALVKRGMMGAELRAADHPQMKTIAQNIGDLSNADKLRQTVVRAALALAAQEAIGEAAPAGEARAEPSFAKNVQALADRLSTPPFSHKVAIAQVYDGYGREYSDAGSLEAFKGKLLAAHNEGWLNLRTLDEPQAMDSELRERSLIKTRYGWYYFVARG